MMANESTTRKPNLRRCYMVLAALLALAFAALQTPALACIFCSLDSRPPIGILLVAESSSVADRAMLAAQVRELETRRGSKAVASASLDVPVGPGSLAQAVEYLVANENGEIAVVPLVSSSHSRTVHDLAWRLDLSSCDDPSHQHDPQRIVSPAVPLAIVTGIDYHEAVSSYYLRLFKAASKVRSESLIVVGESPMVPGKWSAVQERLASYPQDIRNEGFGLVSVDVLGWGGTDSRASLLRLMHRDAATGVRTIVLVHSLSNPDSIRAEVSGIAREIGLPESGYAVIGTELSTAPELTEWVAWQVVEVPLLEVE